MSWFKWNSLNWAYMFSEFNLWWSKEKKMKEKILVSLPANRTADFRNTELMPCTKCHNQSDIWDDINLPDYQP